MVNKRALSPASPRQSVDPLLSRPGVSVTKRKGKSMASNKIKKTYSLTPETAELISVYAEELGISSSAFISLMVNQMHSTVVNLGVAKELINKLEVNS